MPPNLLTNYNLSAADKIGHFQDIVSGGQNDYSIYGNVIVKTVLKEPRPCEPDLELCGTDGSVMVHSAVMLPLSSYLSSLTPSCCQNVTKIALADTEVEVIRMVVQLLYTGKINIRGQMTWFLIVECLTMLRIREDVFNSLHLSRDIGFRSQEKQSAQMSKKAAEQAQANLLPVTDKQPQTPTPSVMDMMLPPPEPAKMSPQVPVMSTLVSEPFKMHPLTPSSMPAKMSPLVPVSDKKSLLVPAEMSTLMSEATLPTMSANMSTLVPVSAPPHQSPPALVPTIGQSKSFDWHSEDKKNEREATLPTTNTNSPGMERFAGDKKNIIQDLDIPINNNDTEHKNEIPSHYDKFRCQHCEFKCRYWRRMVEHSLLLHDGELFTCSYCDYSSFKLSTIKNHEYNYHTGHGNVNCQFCGFKAKNVALINKHVKQRHSEELELK